MQDSKSKFVKPSRYIILDSNIFKYLDNSELREQIIFLLQDSVKKGYGIALSKFTIFELLDTASIENEALAMRAVEGLKQFKLTLEVLKASGHLGCLYAEDKLEINKQPEKGDKIIAGTALINNAVIFTTNGRDFPRPFFNEISKPILNYKKKDGSEVHIVSYFLEPDLEIIAVKYNERIQKSDKQAKLTKKS